MAPPWTRERAWSEAAIEGLLAAEAELAGQRVTRVGEGFDNDVFRLDGGLWLRLPRRQAAVANLEREARYLPMLARVLPLPIPTPMHVLRTPDADAWPVLVYRGVEGRPADALLPAERSHWVGAVAAFLRALQQAPPPHDTPLDVPRGPLDACLQRAVDRLPAAPVALRAEAADRLTTPIEPYSGPPVWCHGDLYTRHLMLDDDLGVSGVIDFGDLHVGDPCCDLSVAWSWFDGPDRRELMALLPHVDSATWRRAQQFALFSGATLCWAGEGRQDPVLYRAGVDAMERALSGPPPGAGLP